MRRKPLRFMEDLVARAVWEQEVGKDGVDVPGLHGKTCVAAAIKVKSLDGHRGVQLMQRGAEQGSVRFVGTHDQDADGVAALMMPGDRRPRWFTGGIHAIHVP